jgi:hypothetical protein
LKKKGKMKHETNISHHDGFRVVGSRNGSYAFTEGRKVPNLLISHSDARRINACARRRGIRGVGCIQLPDYAHGLSYEDDVKSVIEIRPA